MGGGKIILFFICMSVALAFPPLAILVLLAFCCSGSSGGGRGSVYGKIHCSRINYPPCRAYSYEIDKNGMAHANPYRDKRGRIRYCANPNHTHYYGGVTFTKEELEREVNRRAKNV